MGTRPRRKCLVRYKAGQLPLLPHARCAMQCKQAPTPHTFLQRRAPTFLRMTAYCLPVLPPSTPSSWRRMPHLTNSFLALQRGKSSNRAGEQASTGN